MKTLLNFCLILFASSFIYSCRAPQYQIMNTTSDSGELKFENNDIVIEYNLWNNNGGVLDFEVFNKTNKPIEIDWGKSGLVVNNAFNEYDKTKDQRDNSYIAPFSSLSFIRRQSLCSKYHDCNFLLKRKQNIITKEFTKETTPFAFRNHITYTSLPGESKFFENEFYVNKVTLMNEQEFLGVRQNIVYCDKVTGVSYSYPFIKSNCYYFKTLENKAKAETKTKTTVDHSKGNRNFVIGAISVLVVILTLGALL